MNVKLVGDRILVRRDETALQRSGILIPGVAQQKEPSGTVVAVGAGRHMPRGRAEMILKPGDRVWFHPQSGSEVEVEGEKVLVMNEGEVLAYEPVG